MSFLLKRLPENPSRCLVVSLSHASASHSILSDEKQEELNTQMQQSNAKRKT